MGMVLVLIAFPLTYILVSIILIRLLAIRQNRRHIERRGFEVIRDHAHNKENEEAE
ncbi:MAG TPA: hypothetical protein VFE47_12850 [Tepidisphaeraceae bacterium]|jgi:hypothetical protein|nr:hypothetical protein [Tepidisphaeraceae bacterium]